MTVDCPKCGEPLYPDQEWRLQPDLEPGKLETEYDERHVIGEAYFHKTCAEAIAEAISTPFKVDAGE